MVFQDVPDYRIGDIPQLPGLSTCRFKTNIPVLPGMLEDAHAGTVRGLLHLLCVHCQQNKEVKG